LGQHFCVAINILGSSAFCLKGGLRQSVVLGFLRWC
jgi:hypothetical protein